MIVISKTSNFIKKYNLDPNFKIQVIQILNVPASFIGFDKNGCDCWISVDRKTIYVVKQGVDKNPILQ